MGEQRQFVKTARVDCMEFWNGMFNIWQDVSYNHQGKYRLSVQAFYRCQGNDQDYRNYQEGTQDMVAYMYAGENEQKLMSVYAESSDEWVDGAWGVGNGWWGGGAPYFPNSMESARVFFDRNKYWNSMEFESDGNFRIGLKNTSKLDNNWCIFDNFCLEYYGDYVKVTSIDIQIDHSTLVVGESIVASAIVSPANATLTNVQWSSSNEAVAKVSPDGTVTAVGVGQATITATATDGTGIKASVKINVEHNTAEPGSIVINEIMASNIEEAISPAFNFDGWIEIYNTTDRPVELTGLLLSDNKNQLGPWTMPAEIGAVPAKGHILVWFDSNDIAPANAPFKLDTDGGNITISDADGKMIASQDYPASLERISYARLTDGAEEWGYTGTLTPGASNNGISLQKNQLAAPVVDQPSQVFAGMLSVNVTIPGGCTLRYTTDGTLPTLTNGETSKSGQFDVRGTTNYRFRLFADDMLPSRVTTRSYILQEFEPLLPIVSVVTDPDFLYSKEIGVMERGPNGRPGNGQSAKCNWNMNWERPVNFSYIDANGEMVLNQDVNLEMCGGWSRAWTPHAFKLKGSKEMGGDKNLNYPFFEQKPYIRNRTLQIRNGGNDNNCRFKDPSLQYIAQTSGLNIDCQSYQPVHEFINGQYIGVLNVREPNNKHYVYANYGWDDDEIDQFEMSPDSGYVQKCGTAEAFNMLVDDLSPDAANKETYDEICRLLDIDEYINYMAVEMFLGSTDWPQNNVKGFRHRDNGRFRFVLFDIDHAFNTSDPFNTFRNKEWYYFDELYPRGLGRIFDQIRLVTLFENLLENQDFRRRFIDAYCVVAGSVYQSERSTQILDELFDRVQPAMRVNGASAATTYNSVKASLNSRLNSSNNALKNYGPFELRNVSGQRVILDSDTEGAKLFVNDQEVPTGAFNGYLYAPVTLQAKEPAGYQFVGWKDAKGVVQSTDPAIELPTGSVTLTASFKKLSEQQLAANGITPVRINEVSGSNDSYIDEYGKKGDWLELYNIADHDVDVEGMYLTDDLNNATKYQITKGETKANTIIKAHGHLVIWCDNKRATTDKGLHASFKIDGDGGQLQLMAADRSIIDEAYAGDIIGVFDPGIFSIGDTVCEKTVRLRFQGIPSFAPEHFAAVERIDTMKRKQFEKGVFQIAQEGAIQIFHDPHSGVEEILVGVVGVLQFEVLEYRLRTEYGVEVRRRALPYELIRWVSGQHAPISELNLTSDTRWVQDFKGNDLLLFTSEWCVDWALQKNPGLELRMFNQND